MGLPRTADVAIIGAGISGLCTALPLAKSGRHVVVLDRGSPWSDASGSNAGTLSVQVKRQEVLQLTREAIGLWRRMDEDYGVDVGFGQPGGLRVAIGAREVEELRAAVAAQQGAGIEVELHEADALRALAPWLGPEVRAASLCRLDAYSSPLATGNAMLTAARNLGVDVVADAAVVAIRGAPGYTLETRRGPLQTGSLVVAAGAWSGDVCAMLEAWLPVNVDVNMLTVTEPAPPLLDRVVTHIAGILSLKQYPNGTCVIGGGWQGRGDVARGTRETHYERFLHNMRIAGRVVPALTGVRIVRTWAGYEAVAPDALPVLGRLPGHDDAWVIACARGGYSQGPALGARLARMMLEGREDPDMAGFSPRRFTP